MKTSAKRRGDDPARERQETKRRKHGAKRDRSIDRSGVHPRRAIPRGSGTTLLEPENAKSQNRRLPRVRALEAVGPTEPRRPIHLRVCEGVRASYARARRPLVFLFRVAIAAAVVAGAVAVVRLVERHVRTSPAFATREIEVHGLERLERDEVLETAALGIDQNVFEVTPEEAQGRLERHPWIASADVHRRLPGAFEIVIREHRPVALLALSLASGEAGGLYLVADDGTVFKRVSDRDPVDLPIVTGLARARFLSDRAWRASVLLEIVALLHDWRGAGLYRREPIAEVHLGPDESLTLYTGSDGMEVRLGRGPYRQKLSRLRRVLDQLAHDEARPAYVYLDNVRRPDRVTVRVAEAAAPDG